MKKMSNPKIGFTRLGTLLVVSLLTAFTSCNKANDAQLVSSESSEGVVAQKPKVLFIVVDGAVGSEVRTIAPPNLMQLASHSIYSWESLTNFENNDVTNASTWTTLLTGVNNSKHNVTTNLATANLNAYPTVFSKLKSLQPGLRVVALTSSNDIKNSLAGGATVSTGYNNDDAATKNAAVNELKANNPDMLFVQLHSVDAAGSGSSYSNTSATYKAAVLQVDTYIGELLAAVQGRADYINENWLIIVTSNKGDNIPYVPVGKAWSAFDDKRHNTFTFYYNPRFIAKSTSKPVGILPYAGVTPSYIVSGGTAPANNGGVVPASKLGTLMDFGSGSEFTMQCKVKVPAGSYSYPSFIGKRENFSDGTRRPGFLFFLEGNYWGANYMPDVTSIGRRQALGTQISDGQWHTLTAVVRIEAGQRKLVVFTDGVRGNATNMNMTDSYISPTDFTTGWRPESNGGTALNGMIITDIRVYKTALSDIYVNNNYCSVEASATDTATAKLVGFWPSTEIETDGTSNWLRDYSGNNNNMNLKGSSQISFTETTTRICPPVSPATYKTVPNNVDAFPLVLGWFKLPISSAWNLDGNMWVPSYNDIAN
jgi:hypothetical protein